MLLIEITAFAMRKGLLSSIVITHHQRQMHRDNVGASICLSELLTQYLINRWSNLNESHSEESLNEHLL